MFYLYSVNNKSFSLYDDQTGFGWVNWSITYLSEQRALSMSTCYTSMQHFETKFHLYTDEQPIVLKLELHSVDSLATTHPELFI